MREIIQFISDSFDITDTNRVIESFEVAYQNYPLETLKTLLYVRNPRGGLGERHLFRLCLSKLININVDDAKKVINQIPSYGRWDDVLSAYGENEIIDHFIEQMIYTALYYNHDTLCAKWMPRKGLVASKLRKQMNLGPKQWRRLLVDTTNCAEQYISGHKSIKDLSPDKMIVTNNTVFNLIRIINEKEGASNGFSLHDGDKMRAALHRIRHEKKHSAKYHKFPAAQFIIDRLSKSNDMPPSIKLPVNKSILPVVTGQLGLLSPWNSAATTSQFTNEVIATVKNTLPQVILQHGNCGTYQNNEFMLTDTFDAMNTFSGDQNNLSAIITSYLNKIKTIDYDDQPDVLLFLVDTFKKFSNLKLQTSTSEKMPHVVLWKLTKRSKRKPKSVQNIVYVPSLQHNEKLYYSDQVTMIVGCHDSIVDAILYGNTSPRDLTHYLTKDIKLA